MSSTVILIKVPVDSILLIKYYMFMVVDKNTEYYLIHSMGLNIKQIKEMLPSEVERHCNDVIKQRIKETGIYDPNGLSKKSSKSKQKSK